MTKILPKKPLPYASKERKQKECFAFWIRRSGTKHNFFEIVVSTPPLHLTPIKAADIGLGTFLKACFERLHLAPFQAHRGNHLHLGKG